MHAIGASHRRREAPAVQGQAEVLLALEIAQGLLIWNGSIRWHDYGCPVVTPSVHAETALQLCSPVPSGSADPLRCEILVLIRYLLHWDYYAR
jgi:hypothetical protein